MGKRPVPIWDLKLEPPDERFNWNRESPEVGSYSKKALCQVPKLPEPATLGKE